MNKLILTEDHLATIVSALTNMAHMCACDADKLSTSAKHEDRCMWLSFNQSAGRYQALAEMIENAEEIEVRL